MLAKLAAAEFLRNVVEAISDKIHAMSTWQRHHVRRPAEEQVRPTARFGLHVFDRICSEHGIDRCPTELPFAEISK
ncbi:hypothetical protein [Rhodoplanes sp. SY1]|uniref:hypothetical protein n=1 Tax=Rhodoplanes sp. SY1 TaxID=3166646 RepID=UPI0038B5F480